MFNDMGADDGKRVLKAVSEEWVSGLNKDTRHFLLSFFSKNVIRVREELDLLPFDDPLPSGMVADGTPLTLFFRAKQYLLPEEMSA